MTLPCQETDPLIFHPINQRELAVARTVCRGCERAPTCRASAVALAESGVWGGELYREGELIAQPTFRGRPPKTAWGRDAA